MGSSPSKAEWEEEEEPKRELYARLHVSPSASDEEIRRAFRQLSAVAHPDKHSDPHLKDVATENFHQILEAYNILNDPYKRQIYDIYGMEGINSGLEIGPHLSKVDELKEALEKLMRRKEYEKVFARPPASIRLLARLSLPEYLDGGSIMSRMEMHGGLQSQISRRNIISFSGNSVVSGNKGYGSGNFLFRHTVSPVTQVDFMATIGLRSLITFQASRQLSNHSKATSGFTVSLRDGSVNLSNVWTRQLSETSIGNIQLVLGRESSIGVEWNKKEEKSSASGALKLGTDFFGASAHYTHWFSKNSHCRIAGNIGSALDFEIGGGRKISESSMVRVVYNIGMEGISWRFELHRGSQKLLIPVLLSRELNPVMVTGALMIPSSLYFLLKKFIMKPYYRRREQQKAITEKESKLDKVRKGKEAAEKAQKLLKNASDRKKNIEMEKAGLVITKAIYGNIQAEEADAASLVLDVTLPLNFLVSNSQLELHKGIKKSGIMGFCDPCPGEPKQLLLEYKFNGLNHKVTVGDCDPLKIPQDTHKI